MAGTLTIEKISITELDTDCIVNAANTGLRQGGGVCGAIFRAAGAEALQNACNAIGFCPTGHAVTTPGFGLKARYIIHAVGPVWRGGGAGEAGALYRCYQAAMDEALANGCRSIAFPLISSGIYGYPLEEAWKVAIRAIREYQMTHEMSPDVIIAVLDDRILALGQSLLKQQCLEETARDILARYRDAFEELAK